MIVTCDDITEGRNIIEHEYSSNEKDERKIGGESEVEEGFDDCDDGEGEDVNKEETLYQEEHEYNDQ